MRRRKAPRKVKAWAVVGLPSILSSASPGAPTVLSVTIEGNVIPVNERPALAIYETEAAARERARTEHSFSEPARVMPVWIIAHRQRRLNFYG